MLPLSAVVLVLLTTTALFTSAEQEYMLIAPNEIRPGLDYQVSFHYLGSGSNAAVDVELKITEKNATVVEETRSQNAGTFELYTLQIPDSIETRKRYVLEVTGRQGDVDIFHNATDLTVFQLTVSTKTSMVFIQTDKGIYQPGSTIKFRAMSVTPDLLPNLETFDVSIMDPAGNKVKGWDASTLTAEVPVFSGEYQLADRIMFGNWKIEAEIAQGEKEIVTVRVEPYVLPRFDVKIIMSPNMLFDDGRIDGEIISMYSYGKGVSGKVDIQLRHPQLKSSNEKVLVIPIEGHTSFTIALTNDEREAWGCREIYNSCELQLIAEVTEELSGSTQSEQTLFSLYRHREKVTFNNPSPLLKPGLTYKGTISITQQDGSQLVFVDDDLLVVEATFYLQEPCRNCYNDTVYTFPIGVIKELPDDRSAIPQCDDDGGTTSTSLCYTIVVSCINQSCSSEKSTLEEFKIPVNGIVSYEFSVPVLANRALIRAGYKEKINVTHDVDSRFESGNGKSLELKALSESHANHTGGLKTIKARFSTIDSYYGVYDWKCRNIILVRFDMDFRLRSSTSISHAFVLVAAKGKIVYTNIVAITTDDVVEFSIEATDEMAPMCTIIAYFIYDGEVIADVVKTSVSGIFRNEVSTSFNLEEQDAGKALSLTVNAEPNSFIYILAIDKTVLQMAEANEITEQMVEDELGAFGMQSGFGGVQPLPCCDGDDVLAAWRKKRSVSRLWSYSPKNTDRLITDAGLIYLTDISVFQERVLAMSRPSLVKLYTRLAHVRIDRSPDTLTINFQKTTGYFQRIMFDGDDAIMPDNNLVAEMESLSGTGDPNIAKSTSDSTVATRSVFPETWLWTDHVMGDEGQLTVDVTLPDTITTWIATSFAMHPTAGLGIADIPAEVIGFRQFFLYPKLPFSLVRGELFNLDVSVFNYAKSKFPIEATVILAEAPEWYIISGDSAHTIPVPHDGAATVTFKLAPLKPGRMPISISAVTVDNMLTDAVLKDIRVFPEGQQIIKVKEDHLDVSSDNSPLFNEYALDFPDFIVPDSKYVKITLTGNMMGPTIEGLEGLVRRPVGCGEQNMITLVPNIYVRDLLESIGKITPELKEKTTSHMEHGVQRELVYQRIDGSFSAFEARPSDPNDHGSTWLTAFVIQSFTEAIPYITIDRQILDKALSFILDKQRKDGLFREDGRVIHKDMQGGTAGGLTKTMAAYMLITMLMAEGHVSLPLTDEIRITQKLLETEVTAATNDPYLLAITTYALQLAGSSYADALVNKLNSIAVNEDVCAPNATENGLPWTSWSSDIAFFPPNSLTNSGYINEYQGDGRHWQITKTADDTAKCCYSSGPSDIEMTAYVLKTYVLRRELLDGDKVMKWLAKQRNANGGFHTTQDTVLALGAMTVFYKVTYSTTGLNVNVDMTIDGRTHTWTVTEDNADIMHSFEVENPLENDVRIVATGEGKVFVQVIWLYNQDGTSNDKLIGIKLGPRKEETEKDGSRQKRDTKTGVIDMELCLQVSEEVQDMAVCEIFHPSGHIISMGELDSYVDATEVTTSTVFYYRQLPANYSSCSYFQFIKETHIENLKPANYMCYFYYQSGSGTSKPYTTTGKDPEPIPLVLSKGLGGGDETAEPTLTPPHQSSVTNAPAVNTGPLGTITHARFQVISAFIPVLVVGFLLRDQV